MRKKAHLMGIRGNSLFRPDLGSTSFGCPMSHTFAPNVDESGRAS
jgi:hypothetical protein